MTQEVQAVYPEDHRSGHSSVDISQAIYGTTHFNGNVIFNTQSANDSVEEVRVLEAEERFTRSGLDTSAITRPYLIALLTMVDVNTRQLRAIWKNELKFIPNVGLQLYVPRPPFTMLALFASGWLLCSAPLALQLSILQNNPIIALIFLLGFVSMTIGFFWALDNLLLPYQLAKRLAPSIDGVNAAVASRGNAK